MKTILVRNYIIGDVAVSYEGGKKCHDDVLEILDQHETVALDFNGIDYVITAFLNPIIGDLILERGTSVMKYIEIVNANDTIIKKIKLVKDGALMKREDLDE